MANFQSRYVNIKTANDSISPSDVVSFIRSKWPDATILFATHDEPGKVLHTHFVVRFLSATRWGVLRDFLNDHDAHNYCQPARAFSRSVRYLLHLDNAEKTPIPRSALQTVNIDDSELAMLLGAPRACILHDIRNLGNRGTFAAFDWLVNERGHSPNEVAQVLRCLGTIADWVQKVKADESIIDALDESGIYDEFSETSPFDEGDPASEFSDLS